MGIGGGAAAPHPGGGGGGGKDAMVMKVDSNPLYLANVDVKSRQITSKKSSTWKSSATGRVIAEMTNDKNSVGE